MGLFSNLREERALKKESERQELLSLTEKELLVEILLELRKLNAQGKKIEQNQVIWGG